MDSASVLQHPRRNLGSRHRSQADRFVKLSQKDPARKAESLAWAEQNAQQAVLYDFTDERNWRCLTNVKKLRMDEEGMALVLEDLFIVLGRDSNQLDQLKGINHLALGQELLEAAFITDSLEPDNWYSSLGEGDLESFSERCQRLDFTDQRANIIYGRRLERLRSEGNEELFIKLVKHLLAHRPANHELWMELGRLHERRNEIDHAWLCYDHVQQIMPTKTVRDEFLSRLKDAMDGEEAKPWSGPSLETRSDFLDRMKVLSSTVTEVPIQEPVEEEEMVDLDLKRLQDLIAAKEGAEAFFLARSLLTSGETWAAEWMEKAKELL